MRCSEILFPFKSELGCLNLDKFHVCQNSFGKRFRTFVELRKLRHGSITVFLFNEQLLFPEQQEFFLKFSFS